MTKTDILNHSIDNLEFQVKQVKEQRFQLLDNFQSNLTQHFEKFFRGVVSEDITITCTSSGIYFYKKNEQGTYDKEIFSVYLRQNYSFDYSDQGEKYDDAQISYYTTSSNSDWELHRLENLGRVAQLLRNFKDQIVVDANAIAKEYRVKLKEEQFYEKEDELDEKIREFKKEIREIEKVNKKAALISEEGLVFEKPIWVRMKFNFEPKISKLKLIDVSKSGKKATAVFTFAHGDSTSREENVSVERILEQVV